MKRRQLLKYGSAATGIAALSTLSYKFLPPTASESIASSRSIATQLFDTFDNDMLDRFVVDYDHPYRQYHNRGVWAGGQPIALGGFSRAQLSLITDLMYSGLSTAGREIIPHQFFLRLPDIMINNLQICGNPHDEYCQVIITGPHLNLRIGGVNREGVAFGGPQVYGDQRGNEEPGIPGNVYQPHIALGHALFSSLNNEHQQRAIVAVSPIQTQIELQGSKGVFSGVQVSDLSEVAKRKVKSLIDLTLKAYAEEDVDYAQQCLTHNGGVDSLHLSFYADSLYAGHETFHTYRLEGPASVFYFRGYPHVHAYFNIAMDGNSPLSVGEVVAVNDTVVEGKSLKLLFEHAMLAESKTDFAYYNLDSVVGKIRQGQVRTGDLYNAESWLSDVVIVEVKGEELAGDFKAQLNLAGIPVQTGRNYTIATTDYVRAELIEKSFGKGSKIAESGLLRDQLIRYVKHSGIA